MNILKAPSEVLKVWNQFDKYPLETLTKAWLSVQKDGPRQRTIEEMVQHRKQYGTSGNCFDLALWLLHEFHDAGIEAYLIGRHLLTPKAHVAVVAIGKNGYRYLCDLGDQWIAPILLDYSSECFTKKPLEGFFPGANIQVASSDQSCFIKYYRPNGEISSQIYDLRSISREKFIEAGHFSQSSLDKPLCEMRLPLDNEIGHWEFYNWRSFISTNDGLYGENPCSSLHEWSHRIHKKTGMDPSIVYASLQVYTHQSTL
ncbi:hypothetical protein [Polycladospora coralii]|uniref:hypothetical protein n=1 Tax=Polycladospora coralii TaxID=2771432 RepID=UPI00322043BC